MYQVHKTNKEKVDTVQNTHHRWNQVTGSTIWAGSRVKCVTWNQLVTRTLELLAETLLLSNRQGTVKDFWDG